MRLPAPELAFFADVRAEVDVPLEVARTPKGLRRVVPIRGGVATGVDWQARILPGGADFQLVTSDSVATLEAHYVLETDGGDRIYVRNQAIRRAPPEVTARLLRGEPVDPALVYFRCQPTFETSTPALAWINDHLFVGSGVRLPDAVLLSFYAVG